MGLVLNTLILIHLEFYLMHLMICLLLLTMQEEVFSSNQIMMLLLIQLKFIMLDMTQEWDFSVKLLIGFILQICNQLKIVFVVHGVVLMVIELEEVMLILQLII